MNGSRSAVADGLPTSMAGRHWPIAASLLARLPPHSEPRNFDAMGAKVPFSGEGSASQWLEYAVRVHHRDERAERIRKWAGRGGVALIVVGMMTLPLAGAGAVLLIAGLVLVVFRWRLAKHDIEDRKLELFTSTLVALAPDLHRKRPIVVDLDFSAYSDHLEARGEEAFCHGWLSLGLPLADGSQVRVEVTLRVKRKARSKRKYTKVKARMLEQVAVKVAPPRGQCFAARSPFAGQRQLAGLRLSRALVQPGQALFDWSTEPALCVRGRHGWSRQGSGYVEPSGLIAAIVASYKLAARGRRHAS